VNPGVPLATAPVFKALAGRGRGPMPPLPPRFADAAALAAYLRACSNDLMAPAQDLLPEIAAVVRALEAAPACLLARMSGSGPTCFGLFATLAQAEAAATALRAQHPSWWVAPTAPFVATAPGA
jgi:4-diphosphocytidyl-2-C-methyl-D-erythritol kinase